MMSRPHARLVLAAGLIAGMLARSAAAQPAGTACTSALDPACTHLKCYQINDKPSTVVSKTPLLQVDNQFGREVLYRLQPVMLCVPSQKACCCPGSIGCSQPGATQGCSAANCLPNPIQSPGLPHFKCYKIKAKTCPNNDCTTAKPIAFPKKTIFVNMQDQFGRELNIPVGNPVMICAPTLKEIVGLPTTTTTVTTSTTTTTTTTATTTTTIQYCHDDPLVGCTGPCPPTLPPGSQCIRDMTTGKCGCVAPPVCCECNGAAGSFCTNTNAQCPSNCITFANATCDPATRHCVCGFCHDPGTTNCTNIPCSTGQACPTGLYCDTACQPPTPAPCDPCKTQPQGSCAPVSCLRADGTNSQCKPSGPVPGGTCDCCGPTGAFCTSDFDCCSNICKVTASTCQ